MEISSQFKFFLGACAVLIAISLFLLNDIMTIWSGAEAAFLWDILSDAKAKAFPVSLVANVIEPTSLFPFWFRIIGIVLFISSIVRFYFVAHPFLGKKTVLLTSALIGASFLIPVLAKLATLDIWVFAFHFTAFFTLIRYLKEPKIGWQLLYYFLIAISLLIAPISSLIFLLGTATFIWWKHPQGKRLVKLNPWFSIGIQAAIFYFSGLLQWQGNWQIFSFEGATIGKYLLYNLIGILPFIGFVIAGLRDLAYKAKKKEELAIIIMALLLFSLLALSPVLQVGLALIAAKQMLVFYDKNYPFKNWVRTGTILHLVFAFMVSVALMLGGYSYFGALGFRSGLIFCFMYWAIGLIGVFGLYGGENRKMLIGGPILSGVLSMFIFWMQLYPLIESRRNFPKELIEAVGEKQRVEKVFIIQNKEKIPTALAVHSKKAFPDAEIIEGSTTQLETAWGNAKNAVLFKQVSEDSNEAGKTIKKGWNDRLKQVFWAVEIK